MSSGVTVFAIDRSARHQLDAVLEEFSPKWGPRRRTTITVLDTFDGRLHAAGRRLDLVEGGGRRLQLADGGERQVVPPKHTPRLAADLLAGPVSDVVRPLLANRALVPLAQFVAQRSTAVVGGPDVDGAGKLVLLERPHLDGAMVTTGVLLEVHAVPGERRKARRLVARLEAAGFTGRRGDAIDHAVATAGRSLAGHVNFPTIGLDPDMASAVGFRAVLDQLAVAMEANWDGVVARTDPEFLHDFRVAVRRTRSLLAAGRQVLVGVEADDARERLGWLAAQTTAARDLDVYVEEWPKYTKGLADKVVADLAPLRLLLGQRLDQEYAKLSAVLRTPETRDVVGDWRAWLERSHSEVGELGHQPLGATVAQLVLRSHRMLVQRGRLITPESPAEQVHDLRKDAKRLRYLLECFGSLMPREPLRRFVKRLKVLQDNLGEHQDAEVHVHQLAELAAELQRRKVGPETLLAVGRLTERLDGRRLAARRAFAARFAEYDTKDTTKALFAAIDHIH